MAEHSEIEIDGDGRHQANEARHDNDGVRQQDGFGSRHLDAERRYRCVRFATTVASGYAALATKRTLLLTWAGLI